MIEKIHISKEEAKKEIDDLIKSAKEKESKGEENLSVLDSILGGLFLASMKFWDSIGETGRSILTLIFLLFLFFAVFFGGSRFVEY